MTHSEPYESDFEEYLRHVDASKKEKKLAWSTAIGLQQVDGLKPSAYLYETAKRNIEGEVSFEEAKNLIDSYYNHRTSRRDNDESGTEEADKVSSRIAQILSEPSFNFSPSHLIAIHKRLFEGVFKFAGKVRDYDITKKEWVLNGDTVIYGAAFELKSALEYDFEQERKFSYKNISDDEIVHHIAFFVSRLWQIHAFGEGNTRTTAVFTIKYLRFLGFKADNDIFAQNSWYFRNALVRANYNNLQKGIHENPLYLERFFQNLLFGGHNELKNRYTHIDYDEYVKNLPVNDRNMPVNGVNLPVNKIQAKLLKLLQENPNYTYNELAEKLLRTRETVRANLRILEKLGLIKRIGADKNGHWEIVENLF